MWAFGIWLAAAAFAGDPDAGRSVYVAKCQACHGASGKGDGAAAAALPKPPKDMTTKEFWATMTDERLKSTISNGKAGGTMRPFPMSETQLDDLATYLRSLKP